MRRNGGRNDNHHCQHVPVDLQLQTVAFDIRLLDSTSDVFRCDVPYFAVAEINLPGLGERPRNSSVHSGQFEFEDVPALDAVHPRSIEVRGGARHYQEYRQESFALA